MQTQTQKFSTKNTLKFAGAFIAWVIGSGFATGQEVLQFFTSYGYASYGIVLINLIGFLILGQIILIKGHENRTEENFNHFKFYCGNKLGSFYSWLIPITLILLLSVLIAGAGATFYEHYGINRYIGSAIMSVLVLTVYLIGFDKLVKIISMIGPVIILFSLVVGTITIIKDWGNISHISQYENALQDSQSSPHWIISAVLYLSLNFLTGGTYFTALGLSAENKKDAKWGAVLGASALILSITIINTGILFNAQNAVELAIPTLYLAKKISYVFGSVFSVVLLLGMFSSCSANIWTICSRFEITKTDKRKNVIVAVSVSAVAFTLSLFSFSELIAVFYPLVGYVGLIYIGGVLRKGIITRKKTVD